MQSYPSMVHVDVQNTHIINGPTKAALENTTRFYNICKKGMPTPHHQEDMADQSSNLVSLTLYQPHCSSARWEFQLSQQVYSNQQL